MTVLFPLFYFPPISYFSLWQRAEKVLLEQQENFQKQTYRNRLYVPGPNNLSRLVVPVLAGRKGLPYREMKIDCSVDWRKVHWRSLQAAYGKAPFFEHYETLIHSLIYHGTENLWELNLFIMTKCLEELGLSDYSLTATYEKVPGGHVLDARNVFNSRDTSHFPSFFRLQEYYQIFGKPFVPNMSIIDLLMCEGPNAQSILERSIEL